MLHRGKKDKDCIDPQVGFLPSQTHKAIKKCYTPVKPLLQQNPLLSLHAPYVSSIYTFTKIYLPL
ncbi:hypothetical protein DVA81_18240, partial [Acinetobacter baumannii]